MHPLFLGGMILRAHNMPERSGTFMFQWMTDEHRDEIVGKGCEVSLPFGNGTRNHERPYMVSGGFGVNEFWGFLLDFVDFLNDTKSDNPAALSIAGNYGFKQNEDWRPLFPQGQLRPPSKRDGSSNKNSKNLKKKNRGK